MDPLTDENLPDAVAVQHAVFPYESGAQNLIECVNGSHGRGECRYWVLRSFGAPIGIAGMYSYLEYPRSAWIGWLGIIEPFRSQGMAATVFKAIEDEAVRGGYEALRVYVERSNSAALAFFRSAGMSMEERYANPDDGQNDDEEIVIMSKSLTDGAVAPWGGRMLWLNEQSRKE